MIGCFDADHREEGSVVACLLFESWGDERAALELVRRVEAPPPYVPGELAKRELPGILAILGELERMPDCLVVDGYVWLGGEERPGLGGHLYAALGRSVPVIGVAKNAFAGARLVDRLCREGA